MIENPTTSKGVRRMLGLSLPAWENAMLLSLVFAAVAAGAVVVSTYSVVQLQRYESAESQAALEEYKLDAARDLASAKEGVAEANERAAGLEKEAAELRLALERETAARSPRVISEEQRTALLTALVDVPKGPVEIKPQMWDAEIKQYADQLESLFKEANFPVTRVDAISYGIFGTFLVIKDISKPPHHLGGIQDAFAAIGITTPAYAEAYVPDDKTITIGISKKP